MKRPESPLGKLARHVDFGGPPHSATGASAAGWTRRGAGTALLPVLASGDARRLSFRVGDLIRQSGLGDWVEAACFTRLDRATVFALLGAGGVKGPELSQLPGSLNFKPVHRQDGAR